ncbi:UvrD-like helicase, ATP-binding domain, P-loop containing nucleoside triphosphate hydrolase [Tanacetum coccineum]
MDTKNYKCTIIHLVVYTLAFVENVAAELQRIDHLPSKADGSLDILVVGDWGRRGMYNQSKVAFQKVRESGDEREGSGCLMITGCPQRVMTMMLGNHDYEGNVLAQLSPALTQRDSRWLCLRSFVVNSGNVEFFFVDTTPFQEKYFIEGKHNYDWRGVLPREEYVSNLLKDVDMALEESSAQWKIVIGHHTIFSASIHGNTQELVDKLLPILEAKEVDLYINGHDHCLQHISSQDGRLQFLTSGGGSKAWKGHINPWNPNEMNFYYDGQGFMTLQVTKNKIGVAFYDVFGELLIACAGQIPGRDLSYLKEAAQMFESTGKLEYAASCDCDLGEFERAGKFYADKCGKIDAAAECFTLAGCYSEAAEAYAKLDQFSNYISKEIKQVDQEFWESGARDYHERKDPILMMKFVRAFCSMESKRVFLRSLGYLDDLLSLEEEAGHFLEVAERARSWGDLLKEADLFKEATFLLLWYDFLNSLWGTGNIVSLKYCDCYNLSELKSGLDLSQKNRSLRGEILLIRKILDIHFHISSSKYEWENELPVDVHKHCEEMMFQNRVSVRTLLFYWNFWKKNIVDIFESLDSFQNDERNELRGYIDFSLMHFGVRKHHENGNMVYLLVDKIHTDAGWIKNYGQKGLHKDGKRVTIDGKELVYAIKSYWQSELLSVGEKVLNTLEVLHKTKSKGSAFHQSTTLLHIFEVSKFLLDCEYLVLTLPYKKNLQRFLDISLSYFDIVFPLDRRNATSQDLISLRKTDLSVSLIHEIINQIVYIKGNLTQWEIGRVMMICVSSRKPSALYKMIIRGLKLNHRWKSFFKKFWDCGFKDYYVAQTLRNALEDTLCLQVNCSQYLLELLTGRNKILYLLPQKFVSNLLRRRNSGGLNLTGASLIEWKSSTPTGMEMLYVVPSRSRKRTKIRRKLVIDMNTTKKCICILLVVYIVASIAHVKAELQRFDHQPTKVDGSLDILVIGDWGRRGLYNQTEVAFQMGKVGEELDADFIISTGDNFYDDGLIDEEDPLFVESFTEVYTSNSLQKQWYSVLGNHDYRGNVLAQLSPALRQRESKWLCLRSFIVNSGNAEFFFVDTTPFQDKYFTEEKHEYDWRGVLPREEYLSNVLKEVDMALEESSAKWKIVIGHHTIFSASHHGNTQELVDQLLPILEANEVDLYINGHDHCLQHISSQNSQIQFLTSGGGSKAWRGDINQWNHNEMEFYYDGQGFMTLRVTENEIGVAFYDVFREVIHKWSTTKYTHMDS